MKITCIKIGSIPEGHYTLEEIEDLARKLPVQEVVAKLKARGQSLPGWLEAVLSKQKGEKGV